MEETLITFVSTYLLDQDPVDGHSDHHGSLDHHHAEGPRDELLLDCKLSMTILFHFTDSLAFFFNS